MLNHDLSMCSRCQSRRYVTSTRDERLCGPCASCCTACGRPPAAAVEGLHGGMCAQCQGLCELCLKPVPPDGRPCPCLEWRRGPGGDPVHFVCQGYPAALRNALHGRFPVAVREQILQQLDERHYAHRSASQLLTRIRRRWYERWEKIFHSRADLDDIRWGPDDIAVQLVAPGPCHIAQCEDGALLYDQSVCTTCTRPEYRFAPAAVPLADPDRARSAAAAIRSQLLQGTNRTGAARASLRRRDPLGGPRPDQDRALDRARAHYDDPARPDRLQAPPPPPEPGAEESPILRLREDRQGADAQDAVRQAALARARAERGRGRGGQRG
ncbi:hypothetical protein ABT160_07600 [Streptomyces sp. NPDC001941]|uniref:hypothetical protein n=1 Tax=Streptomyces sp. NPDC001941 TaxID=3154659 RepID=UPI00332D1F7B